MIRINLLPHREIKRAERKRELGLMAVATVALGVVLVFMGHQVISNRLDSQMNRNSRLKTAITQLDTEIGEIKSLKEEITIMLDRKQVVENLQSNRSQAVILLDEITRQLPEAAYLTSLKQRATRLPCKDLQTAMAVCHAGTQPVYFQMAGVAGTGRNQGKRQ